MKAKSLDKTAGREMSLVKIKIILLTLIFLFSAAAADAALNMKEIMDRGDRAYDSGKYIEAAVYYRIVLTTLQAHKSVDKEQIAYVRYLLGKAQLMSKAPQKARENMEDFYRLKPGDATVVRDYALALFFSKKYQEAIPVFQKAAGLDKQWEPEARYYIGASLIALGRVEEGKKELTNVKNSSPGSEDAKRAEALLSRLEKTLLETSAMERQAAVTAIPGRPTKAKPWAVSVSLGMEYDSNVGLIPSQQTRPEDISSDGDWRAVHSVSGVYEFMNTGKQFAGVNIGAYGTTQLKDNMFNVESGAMSMYYKANVADTFQFRVSPFVSKTWLAAAPHSWSWGVTPGLSYQPVRWTWTDLNYTYAKTDFTDNPEYVEENRSGNNQTAVLKQNFSFPSLLLNRQVTYFGTWVYYGRSDTEGSSYSNNSRGIGVQAQQEFPLDFTFLLSYSYGKTSYENGNIRSETNEKRDDGSHTLSANVFKKLPMIYKNLSAYAGWRWYKNDSNIERYYSYSSNTYSLGFIVDF